MIPGDRQRVYTVKGMRNDRGTDKSVFPELSLCSYVFVFVLQQENVSSQHVNSNKFGLREEFMFEWGPFPEEQRFGNPDDFS